MRPPQRSTRSEREVVAYLAFMGILLAFGIDASLPAFDALRADFGLEPDSTRISLIVTLYFIGMAVGQLFYGPVADRYGRIPALLGGIGLYSLGTIGSILAPNLEPLLASRLVWGLGAAAAGALRTTVARDLYSGDQMARVISIMMGFFMAGPIVAPVIGEGLLRLGSWRWIFFTALILAAILVAWALRFGETLEPENRRPLELATIGSGFSSVFANQLTLRYTLAMTFAYGAFFSFLGSSQPVIALIYGRGETFALWFGLISIALVVAFFSVNPFIVRHGAHKVAVWSTVATLASSASLLGIASLTEGVPPFWVWLVAMAVANAFLTLLTPTCFALALAPMGDRAGTASGVMGFTTSAGGAALAAIIDTSIDDTVTPMASGYVVYGLAALGLLVLASAVSTRPERAQIRQA
jgi:DHA1 family bicyclomycin/chloramphenicol resistance-like MFS transporter